MKNIILWPVILFLLFTINGKAQNLNGYIGIDITNFLDEIDTIYSKDYAFRNNFPAIKWKSKNFEIYPSSGYIRYINDSLWVNYPNLIPEYSIDTSSICYNTKKHVSIVDTSNSLITRDELHLIEIKKGNKKQLIYIYTGNLKQFHSSNINLLIESSWNLRGVYIEDLAFEAGTFLINLYDNDSCLMKRIMKNKNILKEYIYFNSQDECSFVIKNKGLKASKISSKVFSPNDLERYYKSEDLKKPKAVQKLLSVFGEKEN